MLVEGEGAPKMILILVGTIAIWVPYYDLNSCRGHLLIGPIVFSLVKVLTRYSVLYHNILYEDICTGSRLAFKLRTPTGITRTSQQYGVEGFKLVPFNWSPMMPTDAGSLHLGLHDAKTR